MTKLRDTRIVFDHVTTFAVLLNKTRLAHFTKGFFGRESGVFGFHGAEFVDFETAVIAREASAGVNGGGAGAGEFLDDPDNRHREGGEDEGDETDNDITETLSDLSAAGKRSDADEDGWGFADEFEAAHLGTEHGRRRDEIIEEVVIDGLTINIFGMTIVGLNNDIRLGFFESFFQGGILFATEIFGNILTGGNHSGQSETRFGKGRDVIGEILSVFAATDDDSAEDATVGREKEATNETNEATKKTEEDKARKDGVESHDANWEKINFEEEIVRNNRHHTDNRDKKETADFRPAILAKEDRFAIEAEGGDDDEINWNKEGD